MSSRNLQPCFHYQPWIHIIDVFYRDVRGWKHLEMTHKTKALSSNDDCKSVVVPWFESWNCPQNSWADWTVHWMVGKEAVMIWSMFQANQWGRLKVNSESLSALWVSCKRLAWALKPRESITSQSRLRILMASTGTKLKGSSTRWSWYAQSNPRVCD